jgi:hypothetical protein
VREIKNVGERCPVCHGEERSDEAIHLEFQLDYRARPAGLAMTNPRVNDARAVQTLHDRAPLIFLALRHGLESPCYVARAFQPVSLRRLPEPRGTPRNL